ncbi:NAD-dependent epimerase/dehydratase family protein [Solitalea koreensis]|uniref:Nucleoside-diphosphate-sugar epimerase n=1 Tax=Solitalea koreensis TaxID=543615 RepID=A0A521CPG8_9SPHI|nr:NAD(P)-dependent oxidoreductase [Solitalea koreensis]SMO61326.1 Nucleoside-diphosphate-sugar epimerase [Solitalea koreensis]
MLRVLITGATGFIGSHIADSLVKSNYEVIALKRENSDCWRCEEINDKIKWINLDEEGQWKKVVIRYNPEVFIHSAWIGVEAHERDNIKTQIKNIDFLTDLLEIAKELKIRKFVNLGSQAEYGCIDGKVNESFNANPTTTYGSVKLASLEIFKTFCIQHNINWVWLRLFSFFGEKECRNWLIPALIQRMQESNEMDFTPGLQKYAYLYVKDLGEITNRMISQPIDSGIYNVSSNQAITLKVLIEKIRDKIAPTFKLNFGALSYRENQSMHIEGDSSKLINQLGEIQLTDFDQALNSTIEYYISNK